MLGATYYPLPHSCLDAELARGGRKGGRVVKQAHALPGQPPPNCTCCVCIRGIAYVALRVFACVRSAACVPCACVRVFLSPPSHSLPSHSLPLYQQQTSTVVIQMLPESVMPVLASVWSQSRQI